MEASAIRKLIIAAFFIIVACTVLYARSAHNSQNGAVPITIGINPPEPGPGTQVQITVQLDQPSSAGEVVAIGCTDESAFYSLPSEVYISPGDDKSTFTAYTDTTYEGSVIITATANSVSAIKVTR